MQYNQTSEKMDKHKIRFLMGVSRFWFRYLSIHWQIGIGVNLDF